MSEPVCRPGHQKIGLEGESAQNGETGGRLAEFGLYAPRNHPELTTRHFSQIQENSVDLQEV